MEKKYEEFFSNFFPKYMDGEEIHDTRALFVPPTKF